MGGLAVTAVPRYKASPAKYELNFLSRFALVFYCNAWGRVWAQEAGQGPGLTTRQLVAGGAAAQIVIAPTITAPLERIKILLQVRQELDPTVHNQMRQILSSPLLGLGDQSSPCPNKLR